MTKYAAETTVVLLAAGYGKRMLPLTQNTPKPLLKVGQQSLIEHHIKKLAHAGFKHLVINISHLGEQIRNTLGDGKRYNLEIDYSDEIRDGPLETAGGIIRALPLIRSESFISVNADIFTDYQFTDLLLLAEQLNSEGHLVLVANPEHNKQGDFLIDGKGLLTQKFERIGHTYSGIAHYQKSLFQAQKLMQEDPAGSSSSQKKIALAPLFRKWIKQGKLSASLYQGKWTDVGTPERLQQLNEQIKGSN